MPYLHVSLFPTCLVSAKIFPIKQLVVDGPMGEALEQEQVPGFYLHMHPEIVP